MPLAVSHGRPLLRFKFPVESGLFVLKRPLEVLLIVSELFTLARDVGILEGFVTLLEDKAIETGGVTLEKAVGMRLTFRQPPPLKCFSDQFLLYLNSTVAHTAYNTWAAMSQSPISSLPPERFHFQVVNMSLE